MNYDQCMCYSALPKIRIPVNVIPIDQSSGQFSFMLPIPADFQPIVYPVFYFDGGVGQTPPPMMPMVP